MQLAAKLQPYFSYFLYAQLGILSLAVLVGCVLVLRRILKRPTFEGDPQYDYERIALEIDEEVRRLDDLRDRLQPGRKRRVKKEQFESENLPTESLELGAAATAIRPVAPSPAEIDALVDLRYHEKFSELKKQLDNAAAAKPAASEAKSEETAALKAEYEKESLAQRKTQEELQSKNVHLERVVSEYQIFEEDLALVKKYKVENEQLRQKLEAAGAPAPVDSGPTQVSVGLQAVTEADIADMFNEFSLGGGTETSTANDFAAAFAATDSGTPAPSPSILEQVAGEISPAANAMASEAESVATAPAADPVAAAPGNAMSEEDSEAMAESAVSDDRLLAEFEKLLGGEKT